MLIFVYRSLFSKQIFISDTNFNNMEEHSYL